MRSAVAVAGRLWPAIVAVAGLLALGGAPAAAAGCSNEDRRAEQGSGALPECRAYELAAPGALLGQDDQPALAASQGGAITYYTVHPAFGADSSSYVYRATRGTGDWSYESVGAQDAGGARFEGECEQNFFFSPDLSANIVEAGGYRASEPARCTRPPQIVPGEPDPYRNVFVHDVASDAYQLVNVTPGTATAANAHFEDASTDLNRVVFAEEAKLTPEAPAGFNFYVWSGGGVRLLTVLPDGTPTSGELVEAVSHGSVIATGFAPFTGAMSDDGRRAFFYAGGGLYLRENADQPQSAMIGGQCVEPERACSVQVDASQGPDPGGGAVFWRATSDGSAVFFSATNRLTPGSTAEPGKADLYRYDVESGLLTDLTPHPGEAADVRGVSGIGGDGSHVYFVANGALAPGAFAGDCPGTPSAPGSCNLYDASAGAITFLGRLPHGDGAVWQEPFESSGPFRKSGNLAAAVSPNGRYFAFVSRAPLTGFDNTDTRYSVADPEIFLFDAAAERLSCASCPAGPPEEPSPSFATAGNYGPSLSPNWMRHSVIDNGSVFFTATAPLLPRDHNQTEDVYRFRDDELDLISPGDSGHRARFLDASANGVDIFFRTSEQLLQRDRDQGNFSLYDARVDGGFPEAQPGPQPCDGETCRPPVSQAPPALVPGSAKSLAAPKPRCRHGHRHARRHGRPCQKKKHRSGGPHHVGKQRGAGT